MTAATGRSAWGEHRGYFWPSLDHDHRLAEQLVADVRAIVAG